MPLVCEEKTNYLLKAKTEVEGEETTLASLSRYCILSCENERRLKVIDRINKTPEPAEVFAVKVYHKPR